MDVAADRPAPRSLETARVVWDDAFIQYDFGPAHPMNPLRLRLTHLLAAELGVLDRVEVVPTRMATEAELLTVHEAAYVEHVRRMSEAPQEADGSFGVGDEDSPAFAGMHEASALAAGGSITLADGIMDGSFVRGVNIAGGLHHAMPGRASGFCIYNDAAMAIHRLLERGAERVVYVDLDAHHGDGVETAFWDDPRVVTISLHETGRVLFPGTGFPGDLGGPAAQGSAVNVALPPGTGDAAWLRALHGVVPAIVHAVEPTVLVTQHGCDSHSRDPLAHLGLSIEAQTAAAGAMRELAGSVCEERWLALGGGGYSISDAVPRAWAALMGVASGVEIDLAADTPSSWRDTVEELAGEFPLTLGDDDGRWPWYRSWELGFDPESPVDQAVMAAREAVFPHHGLDPWFD